MDGPDETATSGFGEFYAQQRRDGARLAWLLTHDEAVVEDVVHDAFASVFARFDTLDSPTAYLRRTIVNGVYERARRSGRERRREMLAEAGRPTTTEGPTGGLADVIARLPLNELTVVVLRYWADLDHDSIGRAMGLRASSVRSLLTRATARLRQEINP